MLSSCLRQMNKAGAGAGAPWPVPHWTGVFFLRASWLHDDSASTRGAFRSLYVRKFLEAEVAGMWPAPLSLGSSGQRGREARKP